MIFIEATKLKARKKLSLNLGETLTLDRKVLKGSYSLSLGNSRIRTNPLPQIMAMPSACAERNRT